MPQDEVPLYESKGKQVAKAREGYIPGLPQQGLSQAIMNMTIDTFDSRSPTGSSTGTVPIPGLPPDLVKQAASGSQNQSKSSKKKKPKCTTSSAAVAASCAPSVDPCAVVNGPSSSGSTAAAPTATDPAKRLRNLRKKLRDIECLEEKLESGEIAKPEQEQLDKVARKGQVENEIEELERQLEV